MGKLSERLADGTRSGVYGVEATDALEEAAAQNGFVLERVSLADAGSAEAVAARAARPDGHVLLLTGACAPPVFEQVLAAVRAATSHSREVGERYFVAILDASGRMPLDPLYNRRRHGAAGRTAPAHGVC